MKQAIAGVTPSSVAETTIMTVWPSVAGYGIGQFLGRLYRIRVGWYIFTLGNFIALALAPISALLYLSRVLPGIGERFTLTNRRVIIQKGFPVQEMQSVALDRFDTIETQVQDGQEWYYAGDLIFRQGDVETFRLTGVSRPEAFRQACLKARMAYLGVKRALERELATA